MKAMTISEALNYAKKKLAKKVDDALSNEVYDAVVRAEVQSVKDVVYSMDTSGFYHRRFDSDGIGSDYLMVMEGGKASDGRLSVVNIAEPNPHLNGIDGYGATTDKNLPKLIEYGYNPDGKHGYDYWKRPAARPFIQHTRDLLTGRASAPIPIERPAQALKEGLARQGVRVIKVK